MWILLDAADCGRSVRSHGTEAGCWRPRRKARNDAAGSTLRTSSVATHCSAPASRWRTCVWTRRFGRGADRAAKPCLRARPAPAAGLHLRGSLAWPEPVRSHPRSCCHTGPSRTDATHRLPHQRWIQAELAEGPGRDLPLRQVQGASERRDRPQRRDGAVPRSHQAGPVHCAVRAAVMAWLARGLFLVLIVVRFLRSAPAQRVLGSGRPGAAA